MKRNLQIYAALLTALLIVAGVMNSYADDDHKNQNRMTTRLVGGAIQGMTPEGSADFRTSALGSRLTVEVEDVNLPADTKLSVAITHSGGTVLIGSITLSAFGAGELELDFRDGDTVPALVKGDIITVNSNTTILTGVF